MKSIFLHDLTKNLIRHLHKKLYPETTSGYNLYKLLKILLQNFILQPDWRVMRLRFFSSY